MRFFTKTVALLGLLCTTGASVAFAQTAPANDLPTGAQIITGGPAITGTLASATDNLPGLVGCQQGTGTHPDVWYAFTATGSRLVCALSDPSQTMTDLTAFVYDGPADTTAILLSFSCGGPMIAQSVDGLVTGHVYYIGVSSASGITTGTFDLQIVSSNPVLVPTQDCDQALVLNQQTVLYQASMNAGIGADSTEVTTTNSCWGSMGERQSKWYRFVAGGSIHLQFNINPNNPRDDYDWAVWDITTDPNGCSTKGSAVACNWSGQRGATGLSLNPALEPGYTGGFSGDQFDNKTTNQTGANAPIMLQAGHAYALLIDNFSRTNAGYTLTFGGAGLPPSPVQIPRTTGLDPRFQPATQGGLAMSFSPHVVPVGTAVTYAWTFGDGATSTLARPTHTYAADGLYTVALTVTDVYGMSTTYGRTVRVGTVTGIPADVRARFSLAPNPAKGAVRLTVVPGTASAALVIDGLGRVVRSFTLEPGTANLELSLDGLRPGLYTVRVGAATRQLLVD